MDSVLVSKFLMIILGFDMLLGIAIPVVLYLLLWKFFSCRHRPFWFGCFTFVLFSVVLERFIQAMVLSSSAGQTLLNTPWLMTLFAGVLAGVLEEGGRYVAFWSSFRGKMDHDQDALMFGAGYGGLEAVIVLSATMLLYIGCASIINIGTMDTLIAEAEDPATQEQYRQIVHMLTEASPFEFVLAAVDRIAAVAAHMGLSVIVWKSVKEHRPVFLLLAAGLHTAYEFATGFLAAAFSVSAAAVAAGCVIAAGILFLAFRLLPQAFEKEKRSYGKLDKYGKQSSWPDLDNV